MHYSPGLEYANDEFCRIVKTGDMMKKTIHVVTGQVRIATAGEILKSSPIGSCIVVAAYDSKKRTGAMAHIMLPGRAPKWFLEKTKYAADGIEEMLNQMLDAGTNADDIGVCLVGAGNVMQIEDDTICKSNIESITQILKEKNIPIKAQVLGGTERKSVFMDVENGIISYTEGDEKEKVLWQAEDN